MLDNRVLEHSTRLCPRLCTHGLDVREAICQRAHPVRCVANDDGIGLVSVGLSGVALDEFAQE